MVNRTSPTGQRSRHGRQRRPWRRAGLTYRSIVEASLRLVDERGIHALTMRGVAAELGVEAMSLYHHVPNKAGLLDGLMAALDAEITSLPPSGPWRERIEQLAHAFRASFVRHPEVAKVYAVRATQNSAWTRSVERMLEALDAAGLDGAQAVHAYRIVTAYITGYALGEVRQIGVQPLAERLAATDPASFPLTWQLANAPSTRGSDEFVLGLRLVLDGIEAWVSGPQGTPPSPGQV